MTISFNKEIGKAHVESHTFYEFLQEVQKLTAEGYTLCLENEYFPTQYIGYWSAYFDTAVTQQVPNRNEEQITGMVQNGFATLTEAMSLSQEEVEDVLAATPAEVVNQQDADQADEIPVTPAVPDEQPTEKPKRGRPRLTRDTNTTD